MTRPSSVAISRCSREPAHLLVLVAPRNGILSSGNWIVDHLKVIDTWPAQDALANIKTDSRGTGGAPFNVLVDLAKLGAQFPLQGAGIIGEDDPGSWIREVCRDHQIDVSLLQKTSEAPTSYTDVMTVETDGRRTFFHQRGTNALLDIEMIDLKASTARIFHLGYLLLLDRLDRPSEQFGTRAGELFARASDLGFITSADLVSEDSDRFSRVVLPTVPYVDILFLNEFEAGRSVGWQIRPHGVIDDKSLEAAAEALLKAGVRQWVVIHFPEGVFAANRRMEKFYQPSLNLPPDFISGSAGAGDAIAAAILFGYHEGLPMERSLRIAVCAAAASLRHPSCTGRMEKVGYCLRFAEKYGFQKALTGAH